MAKARTDLIHCDNCGEDYAATYRRCPFCGAKPGQRLDDYDEADYEGEERRGGKRLAGRGSDPAKIALCVLAALVILAVVCILLSKVIPKLVSAPASTRPATTSEEPSVPASAEPSEQPSAGTVPSAGEDDPNTGLHPLPVIDGMDNSDDPLGLDSPNLPPVESDPVSPSATPAPSTRPSATPAPSAPTPASQAPASSGSAKLTYGGKAISDFTITAQNPDPIPLKVQGGTAASWSSKNTNVAAVSDKGTVTAVGNGNTTVQCTLTDGTVLSCTVRVSGFSGQAAPAPSASQAPANSTAKLTYAGAAKDDITFAPQYPDPITLKVQGGTAASWSSKNTNVATVSANGTITPVGNGNTTVQCTLTDGTVLTCTVRVSGF